MTLNELLRGVEVMARSGALPGTITGIHYDSRRIEPGWVFVAIRGEVADGNDFVAQARERGAAAVLSERKAPDDSLPWVQVRDARTALAGTAANWFGRPGEGLRLVGITGTNGKTTTSFLCEAMLRAMEPGVATGLIGTIETHIGAHVAASPHTTPESYDLQQLLAQMRAEGCRSVVMEVSSHALAMERVWGLRYRVAVFTNLTQDHLDFHRTMEAYGAAKRRLFEGLGAAAPEAAVINADDPAAETMIAGFGGRVVRYGLGAGAELRATEVRHEPEGLRFRVNGREIESRLVGRANVYNLLAALGVGVALGFDLDALAAAVPGWAPVRGRFEAVFAGQPFTVLVDYAHTPDALANVLGLARETTRGKVRVVFGCGGDRDKGKRPLMGKVAAAGADWVAITSDNPRSEDAEAILDDIERGNPRPAVREADRRRAIRAALRAAAAGDTVVIAGKGHEDYQIIGTQKLHLDDVEEARAGLAELGWQA